MSDPTLPLAADFEPPDEARWRALAEAALKGAPWEKLVGKAPGGLAIAPLYRETDIATATGGPVASGGPRDTLAPWDIRQPVGQPDAATTNRDALADLVGGATSLELVVAGRTRPGLAPEAITPALTGVLLDLAPVALSGGDGAAALLAHYTAAKADPARARPVLNLDPASAWMAGGGLERRFEDALDEAVAFGLAAARAWPQATVLRASGRAAHEAGASPSTELATLLASGVAHLRALERAGADPVGEAPRLLLTLAAGPDVIVEMAKLRAARLLWARVLEACGARPEDQGARLQAITSGRMMTRYDAWTNILRATAATFAAAVGGADIITTLPMTTALGEASPEARRLARNTQIVLMEECRLGHVTDPGGGAWAVERLTRDLAEAAWSAFQEIEAKGGIAAALRDGSLQRRIEAERAEADTLAARRLRPITGLSDFPLLEETAPAFTPFAAPPSAPAATTDAIAALPWRRLSEPFEALRERGETAGQAVFFANLGPLAEFSARANFARNLFAAGGVAAHAPETVYADHAAMAAAFAASDLKVAVLTGADTRYAAESLPAAQALKAAGCHWLIHAGKPADEAAVRAKGFDQFIFAGQNALEALATLHAALGIKP